jgi:mannose-6-phosphate isomerase-like protein (cupin superfamily)
MLRTRSPLACWRLRPGPAPAVFPPADGSWRRIVPSFGDCLEAARGGVPFQIVRARRYDRRGDPRTLGRALADGATIYFPQAHPWLPRLARLMAAIEAEILGPRREATSYLFLVEGRGREGMGLHHDGELDSVWLQLEGRRTVTVGPRVARGSPVDLPAEAAGGPGWRTIDLEPGTLFWLPPWTPHRVVCPGRSRAVSLTWGRARAKDPVRWDLAPGRPLGASRSADWVAQVPAARAGRPELLRLPGGGIVKVPGLGPALATRLASMPKLSGSSRALAGLASLGLIARRELPLRIVPSSPRSLDGWSFR